MLGDEMNCRVFGGEIIECLGDEGGGRTAGLGGVMEGVRSWQGVGGLGGEVGRVVG